MTEQLVLQTAEGFFLRFAAAEVLQKKKAAMGVRGIRLGEGDRVETVYYLNGTAESIALYREKEVHLNRLRIGKRDTKGTKARV